MMLIAFEEMIFETSGIVIKPTSHHATIMAERLPSLQLLMAPTLENPTALARSGIRQPWPFPSQYSVVSCSL
jgi:hypothetical protein